MISSKSLKRRAFGALRTMGVARFIALPGGNPSNEDPIWAPHDESSTTCVDHSAWQMVLDRYLDTSAPHGIHLLDYAALKSNDLNRLDKYIESLRIIDARKLNRDEQMCYWINLYNALTIRLVSANFPIDSITQLGEQKNRFGPWDDILIELQGCALTLNHIEHRILRPIYGDYRIHFAINCASMGCPNMVPTAFTPKNLQSQLEQAMRDFVNHPRGVIFTDQSLVLSSIFDWYESDFGNSQSAMLATLAEQADEPYRARLLEFRGEPDYKYDWQLNSV